MKMETAKEILACLPDHSDIAKIVIRLFYSLPWLMGNARSRLDRSVFGKRLNKRPVTDYSLHFNRQNFDLSLNSLIKMVILHRKHEWITV